MSSYASKKRRVLEVRKRTKRRHTSNGPQSSIGAEKRKRLYRSEGAIGRGRHTDTYKVINQEKMMCQVSHEMILVENSNPETKMDALLSYLDTFNAEASRQRSAAGKSSRRRKAGVVIFVRSPPTAKMLETRLGPPVSNKSAKQKRHSRHSWKPKGQGRIGGRSEGPTGGDARATAYKTKGVGILHPRSSEAEEKAICRDLRSGKLRVVVVAESGKLGCGDPLWDNRTFVGMVVVYDLPLEYQNVVTEYAAMTTYACADVYGRTNDGDTRLHESASPGVGASFSETRKPRVVSFACLANRTERRSARRLWTALNELGGADEIGDVVSRRLPSRDEMFFVQKSADETRKSSMTAAEGSKKEGVTRCTTTSEGLRERLRQFYERHNPQKLADSKAFAQLLNSVVERCGSDTKKEKALFKKLNEKYAPSGSSASGS